MLTVCKVLNSCVSKQALRSVLPTGGLHGLLPKEMRKKSRSPTEGGLHGLLTIVKLKKIILA